jgi:hypothetical protein
MYGMDRSIKVRGWRADVNFGGEWFSAAVEEPLIRADGR